MKNKRENVQLLPENKETSKVSVIVPLYNREQTIGRALESVLTQSYPVFEVIVVDDCSSDGSAAVVEAMDDSRVKLSRHDKNRGAAASRNTGIKAARGEYVAFQDSDDTWVPQKLELQMKRFVELGSEVGLIYSAFRRHRGNRFAYIPGQEFNHLPKEGAVLNSLLLKNFITPQTVIVRQECFERAGYFNENLPRFHDWELWLRLAEHYEFAYIDQALADVYYSEKSISAEHENLISALKFIIEEHHDMYARAGKEYLSGIYFSYGHNLCLNGKMPEGRAEIAKAIRLNPLGLKNILALAVGLAGHKVYREVYKLLV